MLPEIGRYLNEVRAQLHLDPLTERRVLVEIYTHFQERVAELIEQGVSEAEATKYAIKSFGRARVIARQLYEAYSRGSWTEALISSAPHLMIAGLFFTHLWRHPVLAPILFALIVCTTLFGWWRGKPNWLYSWIGYSLFPLLIGGASSRLMLEQTVSSFISRNTNLTTWLSLVVLLAFYSSSLWIIIRTTIRVVKRDWVLASLMLVPLPILGSWLYHIEQVGGLFYGNEAWLYHWDGAMALVLMVLGISAAVFSRLRARVLKAGAVVIVGVIAGAIAVHSLWGPLGFLGMLLTSLVLLLFLLSPALLEAKLGHGEPKEEAYWLDWIEHPSTPR